MDASSEHPIGNFSQEIAVFKDLAGLMRLGVEELNRKANEGLNKRMPEVQAKLKTDLKQSQVSPALKILTGGIHHFTASMITEVLDTVSLSTGVVIKAKEILGRKKK